MSHTVGRDWILPGACDNVASDLASKDFNNRARRFHCKLNWSLGLVWKCKLLKSKWDESNFLAHCPHCLICVEERKFQWWHSLFSTYCTIPVCSITMIKTFANIVYCFPLYWHYRTTLNVKCDPCVCFCKCSFQYGTLAYGIMLKDNNLLNKFKKIGRWIKMNPMIDS